MQAPLHQINDQQGSIVHDGANVSKKVQLDVVELLKQVLEWTPLYKPGFNTALLQASKVGSNGCVAVLLSAGADVDAEDEHGDTPFVHAFRGRHIDVMTVLKEHGCNTEIAKMSQALATHDSQFVRQCHLLGVQVENEDWNVSDLSELDILLHDLKIDPFISQYGSHGYEDSPFMYLTQEGSPKLLEYLLKNHPCIDNYTEEDRKSKMGSALHHAVRYHRLDNMVMLLDKLGAPMDACDSRQRSLLMAACEFDEPIALELLNRGADFLGADCEGLTSLHWAACVGFHDVCKVLLEKGLGPNSQANKGATPLMVAGSGGHSEVAQLLIDRSCNVNIATPEGWTALHVAVWSCHSSFVELLVRAGACPDVQSSELMHNGDMVPGSTPLLIAICVDSLRIFAHLLDANCDFDLAGQTFRGQEADGVHSAICVPMKYAIINRSWDIAKALIELGCNVKSIQKWLRDGRGPVSIPKDKAKLLSRAIRKRDRAPRTLTHQSRVTIRKLLGRGLLGKLQSLDLSQALISLLRCQDIVMIPENDSSFEI